MATTRTIAAFDDPTNAARAREAAVQLAGEQSVHVNDPDDIRASKTAEGQDEMRHAAPLISTPVMTGPAMKSSLVFAVIGAVVATVLLLPVTYLFWSSTFIVHLALAAAIGVAGGGIVGWLAGGYLGATVSTKPLAAERGALIGVDADSEALVEAMLAENPIRVERVDEHGELVETVAARDQQPENFTRQMGRAYAGHDRPDEIVEGVKQS